MLKAEKRTAVIIPCYNEASTIGKVVGDFRRELPEAAIYVFDNNSTDGTALEAARAGAFVIGEPRQGKGNVVRSMLRKIDADVYVMVDGDDTYDAGSVHELIAPVMNGVADMTVGDRLSSTYFSENKRPLHNSGNRLVRWAINSLFASNLCDILSGYRCFNREFAKSIPVMSGGFEIETELTIFALKNKWTIEEVTVLYRDRPEESVSKLRTIPDGFRIIRKIITLYRDYRPLAFFSLIAAVMLLLAIGFFIPVYIEYLETGLVARFPTLICCGIVAVMSLMLFCSGLILQVITNQNLKLMERLQRLQSGMRP